MANAAPTLIQTGHANVLTVGAGMEFATLADALHAASNGDTIAVQAGTYTNDFGTINANLSIVAVGGIVHEVATEPPPDDKGILTVNANLSITGFTFTGGSDGSPDGNVAGIRLQTGNLDVSYCAFTGMQEGLLANPDPTASVTIDHSEFLDNGTGDGFTHNLYVGAVHSLNVTNSLFEGADVGHEIKSRAAFTTIENNVIADGATGTGSYDIDVPNAGVAVIKNNIIEKGPNASNEIAIHYGGELQYAYARNALAVSGNTIINDLPDSVRSIAVYNESAANGLNVTGQMQGNTLYNYVPGNITLGAVSISNDTTASAEPVYSTQSPLLGTPLIALSGGMQKLVLNNGQHTISGSTGLLVVCDNGGANTITGGAGGLQLSANGGWDQITTSANATDTINLPGRNSVLFSAGTDRINAGGQYETITASGAATITGSGFSTYNLDGAGEVLRTSCSGTLNIGAAANATLRDNAGDLQLTIAAGGTLAIADAAAAPGGGAIARATVSGGAATGLIANSGTISIVTGAGGTLVQAGSGSVNLTGGAGNDTIAGGAGRLVATLGGGADSLVFGGGAASITAGAGADTFVFNAGADGSATITGFQQGTDALSFQNFSGNAIAGGSIAGGSTLLTLSDGTTIELIGVALPGYAGNAAASGSSLSPAAAARPIAGPPASGTLTASGQTIVGGATPVNVTDAAGWNTIAGGSGGLDASAAYNDVLSTAAGSTNTLTLSCYDTLNGAGADQVTVMGYRNSLDEAGPSTIALLCTGNALQGGAALMQVTDTTGGNAIVGGSGGLNAALTGNGDRVTTNAAAADTVSLNGYGTLLSQGTDRISLNGVYDNVTVTGAASITAGNFGETYVLDGADSLASAGSFTATVGGAASATISAAGAGCAVTKLAGGIVALSQAQGVGTDDVTVSGGAATVGATAGTLASVAVTVSGSGMVHAGAGAVTVTSTAAAGAPADSIFGGAGPLVVDAGARGLSLTAGSGNVTLNGGTGADTVTFGGGAITVIGTMAGSGGADIFVVPAGTAGTGTILNWSAQDSFAAAGPGVAAIVADSVTGGCSFLTFQGGAQIELVGVSYPA